MVKVNVIVTKRRGGTETFGCFESQVAMDRSFLFQLLEMERLYEIRKQPKCKSCILSLKRYYQQSELKISLRKASKTTTTTTTMADRTAEVSENHGDRQSNIISKKREVGDKVAERRRTNRRGGQAREKSSACGGAKENLFLGAIGEAINTTNTRQ